MIIYILIYIEALERIECFSIVERSRERGSIKNWEEMCSTKNTVNVDYRQVGGATKIVRSNDPHSIIRVRVVSKHRKPVDKSTVVCLIIIREREVLNSGPCGARGQGHKALFYTTT